MYYVYLIYSERFDIYYKGYSIKPLRRLLEHNEDKSRFTAGKGPWQLKFLREFTNKKSALQFEQMLKRQNRRYLEWLISSNNNQL